MSISSWFPSKLGRQHKGRGRTSRSLALRRRGTRLAVERLEERSVPANYTAATVPELIAAINLANDPYWSPGDDTIELAADTFTLTQDYEPDPGPTGLPTITAAGGLLTIRPAGVGTGATIQRSMSSGTPFFRLFDVAVGASLTLSQVTLQGGQAGFFMASGGGIYNEGSLVLDGVTVQNIFFWGSTAAGGGIWSSGSLTLRNATLIKGNQAWGTEVGGPAFGGGIWSSGTVTLESGTVIRDNTVIGSSGEDAFGGGIWSSGILRVESGTRIDHNRAQGGGGRFNTTDQGGNGYGGGLYIAGGTADLTGATIINNLAIGGDGAISQLTRRGYTVIVTTGWGGDGYGGGLYAAAGSSVTMRGDSVQANEALGGSGKSRGGSGKGYGGGLFIAQDAILSLDAFTLDNTVNNRDSSSMNNVGTANIYGSYTLIA